MLRKSYQFLLVIFFIILFCAPIYLLFRGHPSSQISLIEDRVLGLPEKSYPTLKIAIEYIQQGRLDLAFDLVWKLYTEGALQKKVDLAATDLFPLRMSMILFSKAMDRTIIELSYQFTGDSVIPADMTSGLFIMLDEKVLIYPPATLDKNDEIYIQQKLRNYRELSTSFPEVNFYIYYIEALEFSPYNPLNKYYPKADKGQAFEDFIENLPETISVEMLSLESLEVHLQNFYRTDHHWNTNGILKGYDEIYDLLAEKYPNIPDKLLPTEMVTFEDIQFQGTFDRQTLYPIPGDTFTGFNADFPSCKVKEDGVEGQYNSRDKYLKGEYSTLPYVSHYGLYFGTQKGMIEFDCEVNADRNLLIIGDSYARPLVSLLAAQYKHTYFVDLRQNKDFTLSGFLRQYPVKDILFVGGPNVIFLDADQWNVKIN